MSDLLSPVASPLAELILAPSPGTFPRSVALENLDNSRIYQYYPDNVQMLGLAFSTTENYTGIAINGEISYKHDAPILISTQQFFIEGLNRIGGVPFDQASFVDLPLGRSRSRISVTRQRLRARTDSPSMTDTWQIIASWATSGTTSGRRRSGSPRSSAAPISSRG
ncbi:DUF1302 family protein [Oleomonas cavernae]|uniref:DUF1302 family protein n=1 Tax=Oleomonas cavernae TaxID=2320859 RepID=UPI001313E0E7|nr:DUF1302 family protein [Oleomonas cavernae]